MRPVVHEEDAPPHEPQPSLVLRLRPVVELTGDQLLELSSLNRDLRLELTAKGELVVMPPTGAETGERNLELAAQLWAWAKRDGTGMAFDSSTGFTLPNGAVRSPDVSWVPRSRLEALTAKQRKKVAPLCPDFVIELREVWFGPAVGRATPSRRGWGLVAKRRWAIRGLSRSGIHRPYTITLN